MDAFDTWLPGMDTPYDELTRFYEDNRRLDLKLHELLEELKILRSRIIDCVGCREKEAEKVLLKEKLESLDDCENCRKKDKEIQVLMENLSGCALCWDTTAKDGIVLCNACFEDMMDGTEE